MRYFLLTLLLFPVLLAAQTRATREPLKVKFGQLEPGELGLMPSGIDSAASAYVLFDSDRLSFTLTSEGYVISRDIHRRVKLIHESSFDRADVELTHRHKGESISRLKAMIHLPDGRSIEIKRRDMIKDELVDNVVNSIKWTFPEVTEGAIIEYSYELMTDRIAQPSPYYFQESIPVRYTEFKMEVPGLYSYVSLGNATNYDVFEKVEGETTFNGRPYTLNSVLMGYYDMAAYDKQPYVSNFYSYVPHVRYQLSEYALQDGRRQKFFTDWFNTTQKLDESNEFGRAYKSRTASNAAWDLVEDKVMALGTDTEKAQFLYDFVTKKISWNGNYDWTADNSPDKTLDAGTGDSAEMSMLLLALLHKAKIESHPVLVPLRGRGLPITVYPILSQFDHLMLVATLDGKEVILDPNDGLRPIGLPRMMALNGQALVADPDNPHWMDVVAPKTTQTVVTNLAIDGEGMASVDVRARQNNYYAYTGQNEIDDLEEDAEFPIAKEIIARFPTADVVSKEVLEAKKVGDLELKVELKAPVAAVIDDYMYVQPVLVNALESELKDIKERLYPVDFAHPWKKRYISKISIPEGYVAEELPIAVRYRSEDGSLTCTYSASTSPDNSLAVNFTVEVDRAVYQAGEYGVLREMFEKIIELQESTIVLKKAK